MIKLRHGKIDHKLSQRMPQQMGRIASGNPQEGRICRQHKALRIQDTYSFLNGLQQALVFCCQHCMLPHEIDSFFYYLTFPH